MWAKLAPIYSKRHLQHDSMPFFPLASRFTTNLLGHAQKSNFDLFGVFIFSFFSPFLICFFLFSSGSDWPSTGPASSLNISKKASSRRAIFTMVGNCRCRKFCSPFFTQISKHFCAYLKLHLVDHYDPGIIGKMFFCCRSWVYMYMMPISIEGVDVRGKT